MKIMKLVHNGKIYNNWDADKAMSAGVPQSVVQQALLDQAWELVREERDRLIAATDYAIMPDYPLTDAEKADVTAYRQALRDIPETFASPDAVEWPAKPEALA